MLDPDILFLDTKSVFTLSPAKHSKIIDCDDCLISKIIGYN